jgi:hypothetical protein
MKFEAKGLWMEFEEGAATIKLGGDGLLTSYADHDQWCAVLRAAGFPWGSFTVVDVRELAYAGPLSTGVFYWMAMQVERTPGATLEMRGRSAHSWQERVLPVMPRICRRIAIELR